MTMQLIQRPTRGPKTATEPVATFALHAKDSAINGVLHAAMGHPTHVQLLFDPEELLLGLRPCTAEDAEAFTLSVSGVPRKDGTPASGRKVVTKAIVDAFDLAAQLRHVYSDITELDGMWVVNLRGASREVVGRKPKTPAPAPTPAPVPTAETPAAESPSPARLASVAPLQPTDDTKVEMRLRCNDCDASFDANDSQNFHRHLLRQHDRRAQRDERTPRPAA